MRLGDKAAADETLQWCWIQVEFLIHNVPCEEVKKYKYFVAVLK